MISNVVDIGLIQQRRRWDFASYHPDYEQALESLKASKWKTVELGDLVEFFKYGASIPAEYVAEGLLFIRAQNIRDYGIDLSDVRYVTRDTAGLERHIVQSGDIVITRSGINVGDAAVIPDSLDGVAAHGSYSIRIRIARHDVSPEYIAFAINSPLVRSQITAFKSRSAQPNINIAELSRLKIILPPRPIQDQISQTMRNAYEMRQTKLKEADQVILDAIDLVEQMMLGEME